MKIIGLTLQLQKNPYSLVGQVCIKFGAVGPVLLIKWSTLHTIKFLKILDLNSIVQKDLTTPTLKQT